MTITTDEDGIRNYVSIRRATLAPSAKYGKRQLVYMPNEPVNERDDKVDEIGGQTTAEKVANAPCEYTVDCILHHVGEGDGVRYLVRWYGYASADDTVDPPEHIPNILLHAIGDNRI